LRGGGIVEKGQWLPPVPVAFARTFDTC